MTQDKKLDRKSFLTSTVAAWAIVSLDACSGESETGGTDDGGSGTGTGGTSTGGTGTGGTGTGGTSTGGTSTGGTGLPSVGGSATGGSATGGSATGGSATGGSSTGGGAGMSGGSGGMMSGGSGGSGGGGGDTFVCTAETDNGDHSHPLTIPGSDIDRGFQTAPYILEDGGTGHTHTLELASYEWAYLAGGSPVTAPSSMDAGHTHDCVISCVIV